MFLGSRVIVVLKKLLLCLAFTFIVGELCTACVKSDPETITSPEEEVVESIDPEEDTRCKEEYIRGNSVGNIGNNGFAALQGEWIYYKNSDDDYKLYKIKTDGSKRQKVSDDTFGCINVVGDWIYYSNWSEGYEIYKVKTDGSERQK